MKNIFLLYIELLSSLRSHDLYLGHMFRYIICMVGSLVLCRLRPLIRKTASLRSYRSKSRLPHPALDRRPFVWTLLLLLVIRYDLYDVRSITRVSSPTLNLDITIFIWFSYSRGVWNKVDKKKNNTPILIGEPFSFTAVCIIFDSK